MGAASGVIGLATQGVGLLAGGGGSQTQYQPNPAAKYEADMALFQRAQENQKLAEDVLNGQLQTQTAFTKYQYDMQNQLIDAETQGAMNNLEAQYNMGLFNASMTRLANEADRYTQLTSFQMQREQANFDFEQKLASLGLTRDDLQVQQQGINTGRAEADAGYNRQKTSTQLQKDQLKIGAEQDKQALSLANKTLDLREAGLVDARTGINYQEQGIDLAQIQSDAAYSQELQALSTRDSEATVSQQIAKANAQLTRQEALRQISVQMTGNADAAAALYNNFTGSGFRDSAQTAAVQAEMIDTDATKAARSSLMSRYGLQATQADLGKDMALNQTAQQRRASTQNKGISDQNLGNQKGQLGLARNDLDRQAFGLGLERDQASMAFQNAQSAREMQTLDLASQEQYDLLSKSLLANAQFDQAQQRLGIQQSSTNLDQQGVNFANNQANKGINAQQSNFSTKQGVQEAGMQLGEEALLPTFTDAQNSIQSQRTMNDASNWANYVQQQGANSMAQSAGLNQIAGQTQGLLSQIGSYPTAAPAQSSGGGVNWGGIGKFGQSLMGVLGGMGGGGQSAQYQPQLMPAYSPAPTYGGYQQAPAMSNQAMYQPPAPAMGQKAVYQPIAPYSGRK